MMSSNSSSVINRYRCLAVAISCAVWPAVGTGCEKAPGPASVSVSIETSDGKPASVFINGAEVGKTPFELVCTPAPPFDPAISFGQWPPLAKEDLSILSSGLYLRISGKESDLKLAVGGGRSPSGSAKKSAQFYPKLTDGEHLLFIQEQDGGHAVRGAVRFRVVGADGTIYSFDDEQQGRPSGKAIFSLVCVPRKSP